LAHILELVAAGPGAGREYGLEPPSRKHAFGFVREASPHWASVGRAAWREPSMLQDALVNAKHGVWEQTRLHWAAANNRAERMRELLDMKLCDINARDTYGFTPLQIACYNGHSEAALLLLSHPSKTAEIDAAAKIDADANNMVFVNPMLARWPPPPRERVDRRRNGNQLLRTGDWLRRDVIGNDPLGERDDSESVERSPLILAVLSCSIRVVSELLQKFKADPNERGKEGSTALHLAVERGFADRVRELLSYGASKEDVDRRGYTALKIAFQLRRIEIAELLVKDATESNLTFSVNPMMMRVTDQPRLLRRAIGRVEILGPGRV
jgi:ankyrin repeat protein